MRNNGVEFPTAAIEALCRKWSVVELALFGSVLRADFRPDSDIDVLVTFDPDAKWDLLDFVALKEELEAIFRRSVDLVEKPGIRNPIRRKAILDSQEVLYVA